jgi:hypothetical protein
MSANQANKRLQKRSKASRASRVGLTSVARAPNPPRRPDQEFVFERQTSDLTCYVNQAGVMIAATPPGTSTTDFILFGPGTPELVVPGIPPAWAVPFTFNLVTSSLPHFAKLIDFWTDFQIRAAQVTFESLNGDSYSSGITTSGSPLPEVLAVAVPPPAGVNFPADIESVMAYPNVTRQVMTQGRPHRMNFRPRASTTDGDGFDYYLDSVKAPWYNTGNQYFGMVGWFRNYPAVASAAGPFFPIRITAKFTIACRRPR